MRFLFITVLFTALFMAVQAQNTNSRVKAANNQLSIVLPEGFTASKSFNGFINPKSASSILLYYFPDVGFHQYADSLNSDYFQAQQLELKKQYPVNEPGLTGQVYECRYYADTIAFNRYFYLTGNKEETIFFMINYPTAMTAEMRNPILETVRSIKHE